MTKYWYEYTHNNGLKQGFQPDGFVDHNEGTVENDTVAYDRKLTEEEMAKYNLKEHKSNLNWMSIITDSGGMIK